MHPALHRAFASLDRSGVRWAVVRGADELHEPGGDVDILVHPADTATADRTLDADGWVRDPRRGAGTHRFFARWSPDDARWLKLDAVTALAFGRRFEIDTHTAAGTLDRRRQDRSTWRLDPRDELAALTLHLLLDRRGLRPGDRERLSVAVLGAAGRSPAPEGSLESWADRIEPGLLDGATQLAKDPAAWLAVRRRIRRRSVAGDPFGVAASLVAGWSRRRIDRLAPSGRRGISVALLGPDGSGKSSLIDRMAADAPLPVRRVYLGLYPVDRRRSVGTRGRVGNPIARAIPGASGVLRVLRMWRGWAIGETHVRRGGITLYDRHPLEALVGANPRRRDHVLARVCPAPDLVIVLDAPPATLHARKPEHPVSIVEQQRAGYASLAASRAGARVVDGTPPMPDVERAVWSEVWQAWRRTRGRHQSVVPV